MSSTQHAPRPWTVPGQTSTSDFLAKELGCPTAIAELLLARGIDTPAAARAFFDPTLDGLHDPNLLLGMPIAVERIQRAVRLAEPILIYGDYDVDGTTATALLKTAIERIASKETPAIVRYHVPHRIREGYGMQTGVLGEAAVSGIRLVISVDTGIRAFAAAAEAKALGLDLIVTDHHLPDDMEGIPEAIAVLNPAQSDCPYPNKSLCGAGVAFKLAHALLLAHANAQPDSETQQAQRERLQRSLLPSFLKLVAIATIADAVPLAGENRTIAALGLRELRNPVQPGLRALMQVAQIPLDRPPTATEIGFRLGPRINAAGRMDVAGDVVELFLTRDSTRAIELAEKLNRLNEERRATEAEALEAIETQLNTLRNVDGDLSAGCLVLDDPDWHRGVLGILASRIVDRTGRPALVLTHQDGQAHGSGRSIAGFHLLDTLSSVHRDEANSLFTRFGGHAHAVGFSLPSDRVELLRESLERYSAEHISGEMMLPPIECDAELAFSDLTPEFYEWLQRCEPFGIGNREPVFVTRELTLAAPVRIIKEKHICLDLCRPGEPRRLSALGWSRITDWAALCSSLSLEKGSVIDVAYRLRWKSNTYTSGFELELVDISTR